MTDSIAPSSSYCSCCSTKVFIFFPHCICGMQVVCVCVCVCAFVCVCVCLSVCVCVNIGASVVNTRCSETYRTRSACLSLFGFPLWYHSESPRTVIQVQLESLFPAPSLHPSIHLCILRNRHTPTTLSSQNILYIE